MATSWEKSVLVSQTSPAFLHANSTSHTWVFSAIAEIIDNAYDPDVSASWLSINYETQKDESVLIFKDNGNGMDAEKLHKMLSFGYCEKVEIAGHKPVGHYGNGFKSGSMRLGRDAFVFTKNQTSLSCGMLSQNFLKKIEAQTVLVPILTFNLQTKKLVRRNDTDGSQRAIQQYSQFKTITALLEEFEDIETTTGTKIIISDLKRGNDGKLELDFESNPIDIRNPEHQELDFGAGQRPIQEYTPEYRRSLREYCSILFLKPRMKIYIRDKKVQTKLVSKSLSRTERDVYKPMWQTKPIKIIFGFGPSKEDFGIMMYHRNRLIKAYEKVGCQKQADERGVGVVGVVSVDFLEPIHNKQDFNKTDRYNACMNRLGSKLLEYWSEKTQVPMTVGNVTIIEPASTGLPDWTWVQCDNCLKWRRLPDGVESQNLPDKWFCYSNPDPVHSRCDMEEEPEDEDELLLRATYQKTQKQASNKDKAMKKQSLTIKEHELKRKEEMLQQTEKRLRQQQMQQPLADGPGENKPTLADLEKAKQDLLKAKHREEEQKRIYTVTLQQKQREIEERERKLQATMKQNMARLHQASGAQKRAGDTPSTSDPSNSKKTKTALETSEFVITRNESGSSSSSCEDEGGGAASEDDVICLDSDDETWKTKKKGKLPKIKLGGKKANKKTHDDDVKPDLNELNNHLNTIDRIKTEGDYEIAPSPRITKKTTSNILAKNNSINTKSTQKQINNNTGASNKKPSPVKRLSSAEKTTVVGLNSSNNKNKTYQNSGNNSSNKNSNTSSVVTTSTPAKASTSSSKVTSQSSSDVSSKAAADSNLKKELEQCKKQLSTLRGNVRELLKVIVPDLEVKDLSYIDDIVVEMIKVNSLQNGGDNNKCDGDGNSNNSSGEIAGGSNMSEKSKENQTTKESNSSSNAVSDHSSDLNHLNESNNNSSSSSKTTMTMDNGGAKEILSSKSNGEVGKEDNNEKAKTKEDAIPAVTDIKEEEQDV